MSTSGRARVAILTRARDFHAFAIRHALASRGVACAIVETDALATRGGMSWSTSNELEAASIRDIDGDDIVVRNLDLVWWRRLTGDARLPESLDDEAARDLVTRDCRATLVGLMLTEFRGRWISHPEATRLAENKLVQLAAARRAGLRLPRTLISQSPEIVRSFCQDLELRVVVKTVAGTPKTPIMTGELRPEMLASDAAISVSPAIYQELVPGTRHLRVCCFGDDVYAALLETEQLDWRYPLEATAEAYDVDERLAARLCGLLRELNLSMGIFDLKLPDDDGEPVWLEVNPQGQFLFLEGMCGLPLTEAFADFLVREAGDRVHQAIGVGP